MCKMHQPCIVIDTVIDTVIDPQASMLGLLSPSTSSVPACCHLGTPTKTVESSR